MKIIQVHNYYQQAGGEDAVVEAERLLLSEHGHEIVTYYKRNDSIVASGNKLLAVGQLLKASLATLWNQQTYREFKQLLKTNKPDIVHCHNTFPVISPSIYWACAKEKIPVVQTLHNYRLLCLNAFLFRQTVTGSGKTETKGAVCELCVRKRFKWPGIKNGCYRGSKAGSLVVALMLFFHKLIGTWSNRVTAYITLTDFQKEKMIGGGVPDQKIWVKPNFIDAEISIKDQIPGVNHVKPETADHRTPYALFVGRLSPEKGCDVLIRAWDLYQKKLKENGYELSVSDTPRLIIVGDGPERVELEKMGKYANATTISFVGTKPKKEVHSLMRNAQFLVSPSTCYETFGLVVLEAGMLETPSIVGEPGTIAGLVDDNKTGLLYPMGDSVALSDHFSWAFDHLSEMQKMGVVAQKEFKEKYSATANHELLMDVYKQAMGSLK